MSSRDDLIARLEAILYASGRPLSLATIVAYLKLENEQEAKQLTIVSISGPIRPEDLQELGGHFGIPRMESERTQHPSRTHMSCTSRFPTRLMSGSVLTASGVFFQLSSCSLVRPVIVRSAVR